MLRIGVDSGPERTAVVVEDRVTYERASTVVPSAVALDSDGTICTGDAAAARLASRPDSGVTDPLARLREDLACVLGGRHLDPAALAARLMTDAIEGAAPGASYGEMELLVAVPDDAGPAMCRRLREALADVGMPRVAFQRRSGAALAAHGLRADRLLRAHGGRDREYTAVVTDVREREITATVLVATTGGWVPEHLLATAAPDGAVTAQWRAAAVLDLRRRATETTDGVVQVAVLTGTGAADPALAAAIGDRTGDPPLVHREPELTVARGVLGTSRPTSPSARPVVRPAAARSDDDTRDDLPVVAPSAAHTEDDTEDDLPVVAGPLDRFDRAPVVAAGAVPAPDGPAPVRTAGRRRRVALAAASAGLLVCITAAATGLGSTVTGLFDGERAQADTTPRASATSVVGGTPGAAAPTGTVAPWAAAPTPSAPRAVTPTPSTATSARPGATTTPDRGSQVRRHRDRTATKARSSHTTVRKAPQPRSTPPPTQKSGAPTKPTATSTPPKTTTASPTRPPSTSTPPTKPPTSKPTTSTPTPKPTPPPTSAPSSTATSTPVPSSTSAPRPSTPPAPAAPATSTGSGSSVGAGTSGAVGSASNGTAATP
ncbi:hypothetical protein PZ938_11520 [Luteipulveratus sp. YIM 133132]|uniref:hypothetical protein n=1 Tax=Luteipulveratus flavus TaxID=3031728 RepID=UPI0023B10FCA|nr:hypothetical protein [Luteipulveratus sp. YIM 133132]MDE9366234.1 hypothetical protein [Luteipulveratus sp. YIM 133132]